MKTLEEKLSALKAKHSEDVEKTKTEYEVLQHFMEIARGYKDPSVHVYTLYKSVGSIHFGRVEYSSIDGNVKSPDRELLRVLLATFPPMPKVKVSDGCTSFRPDFGETWTEKDRARGIECKEYECFGVTIDIELMHMARAEFKWYAQIDGKVWALQVDFALHQCRLGRLDIRMSGEQGGGRFYETCQFYTELGLDAQKIKWSSGGPEYPNRFTLYFDRTTGERTDFPALTEKGV